VRKNFLKSLLLTLLLLLLPFHTQGKSNDSVQFEALPRVVYDYNGVRVGDITYRIHLPVTGHIVCTGWRYPIAQLDPAEWPQRKSCRTAERAYIEETWGGSRFPFPYLGDYIAFVDSYHDGVLHEAILKFTVIEGIPR
jgi:hypothetical protein